ncbi:DUF1217 domain-containing protein [Rhizobium sp. XQZ8]|uniref:DUF1217 domain-containing protein n=1 Tax=Rhizobium populisoli TaxID=2859785 RepID=UPI001CA5BDB7|nr:DUF1217 domain-containing protein [Rhizobium populisoli]MBW6420953.1 DUF1217 domain-containing protein [Rhizobium populisoli]
MVSTYLTFDLVNRDIQKSLKQVSSQTTVANDSKYYQDNIGKVKSVDEFLDNYRLFSFAMKAHGLEDMIYAKAFMKQVLESDLSDDNSFANRLTDDRYSNFASAFNFGAASADAATAQSNGQMDKLLDTYDQTIAAQNDEIEESNRYFKVMFGPPGLLKNVDQFLQNEDLRQFVFTAYGIDQKYFDFNKLKGVLTSDPNDPNSYYQQNYGSTVDEYTTDLTEYNELGERKKLLTNIGTLTDSVQLGQEKKTALTQQRDAKQADLDAGNGDAVQLQKDIDALNKTIQDTDDLITKDQASLTTAQTRVDELNGRLVPVADADARMVELDKGLSGGAQTEINDLNERQTLSTQIPTYQQAIAAGQAKKTELENSIAGWQAEIDAGGDASVLQPKIDEAQVSLDDINDALPTTQQALADAQARYDVLNAHLVSLSQASTRLRELQAKMQQKTNDMSYIGVMKSLMTDFQFNTDGTVPATGALTADKMQEITKGFFNKQTKLTHAEAMFNQEYFEKKAKTATTFKDLTDDPRILQYLKTAFNLDKATVVKSTIESILTTDLTDPNNYIVKFGNNSPDYLALNKAFNFNTDGTVKAGGIQDSLQVSTSRNNYMSRWDDKQETQHTKDVKFYKIDIAQIKTLDEFLGTEAQTSYEFALEAVGIDPSTVSKITIKNALKSDLSDPNSYIYKLKDERILSLAKLFNFGTDGKVATPVLAQSNSTITNVAKDYILRQTRFLKGDELDAAKKKASDEAKYYTDTMQKIDTRDALLKDRKLMDILLTSKGIDPKSVTDDFLKKAFTSDISDPTSFINTQADKRFAQIVGTFNFTEKGDIDRSVGNLAQNGGEVAATQANYVQQLLEAQEGEENNGVRLALYFQRMADTITDPYVILGDEALMEFFRVTYQLPSEIGNMDVDQQAKLVKKKLNLEELADPEKLKKLIQRFTIMYDIENATVNSPALDIMNSNGGGVSADTLWALSQLKVG